MSHSWTAPINKTASLLNRKTTFLLAVLIAGFGCFIPWWYSGGIFAHPMSGINVWITSGRSTPAFPSLYNEITLTDNGGLLPLILLFAAVIARFSHVGSHERKRDFLWGILLGLIALTVFQIALRMAQFTSLTCIECPALGPGMFLLLLGAGGVAFALYKDKTPDDNLHKKTELPSLTYTADGLIPAIVQHHQTGAVLLLAYMNAESLRLTLQTGETHFWSRSRQELWHKGATSGNTQRVVSLHVDCDADTLLVRVDPAGPACHTGAESCFFRTWTEFEAEQHD